MWIHGFIVFDLIVFKLTPPFILGEDAYCKKLPLPVLCVDSYGVKFKIERLSV